MQAQLLGGLGDTNLCCQLQAFLFLFVAMPDMTRFADCVFCAHTSTSLGGRILAFQSVHYSRWGSVLGGMLGVT